jgi:predicted RNA-binding protein with PUA-like domain
MNYWLVKADPDTDYSIDDLERDGQTEWTGVHNFQAIINIKLMKPGDSVYFYHSQKEKSIVGLAKVSGAPYENLKDPRKSWAVQLSFIKKYINPLHLSTIKSEPAFSEFLLVRNSRLSVMPVSPIHKTIIDKLLS